MRRVTVLAVSLLALSGVLGACSSSAPSDAASSSSTTSPPAATSPPAPTPQPTPTSAGTPTAQPVNTIGWITYVSERYGFSIGHPPGWTVSPADRDWTLDSDAGVMDSSGQEGFLSPDGDIWVTAWSVPATTSTQDQDSYDDVEAWVEQYCELATAPCTGIHDRAVKLCSERRDCHPGLLVPFRDDVQAFFTGGFWDHKPPPPEVLGTSYTVVAVWRPESHSSVAEYGGSRALLEGFLSTMDVCPARPGASPSGCAEEVPKAGAATGDPLVTSSE